MVGNTQCLGNAFNKSIITCGKALLNKGGVTADKVNANCLCRFFKCYGKLNNFACLASGGKHCNRGHGNALVYNGNAIFMLNFVTNGHQILGGAGDFFINLLAGSINVRINAVKQRNAHCNGANVKIFILNHCNGF